MSQTNDFAASITKASESVTVIRGSETLTLNQGDGVYATDTIITKNSSVEITFTDGATVTLSPEATMTVQEFSYNTGEPSFVLNLAQGAMRTISGEVVEQNPDAFKIVTPRATVGIRGTEILSKVGSDGTETHGLVSTAQGRNVVITTHSGQSIALTVSNQGVIINKDNEAGTLYNFTPSEMESFVNEIAGTLGVNGDSEDKVEAEDGEENDDSSGTLELDQALLNSLTDASVLELLGIFSNAGLELGEDLTNSLNFDVRDIYEIFLGAGKDGDLVASGYEHFMADSNMTSGIAGSQNITVANNVYSSIVISGDVWSVNGNLTGGNDIINAKHMSNGRLVGDAEIMYGGTLNAGNDIITTLSKTGGNSIYGDLSWMQGGSVNCGDDLIVINGKLSRTTVSGDVGSGNAGTVLNWGNDTIIVHGNFSGTKDSNNNYQGAIYGDSSRLFTNDQATGGNDSIVVNGYVSDAIIAGGTGNDTITITGDVFGGSAIYGSMGYSQITITGDVFGTSNIVLDGAHSTTPSSLTINGDLAGQAKILGSSKGVDITINGNVTAYYDGHTFQFGGAIDGSSGNDTITITGYTSHDTTIRTDNGDDYIYIGNLSGGIIDGEGGNDTLEVGTFSNQNAFSSISAIEHVIIGNLDKDIATSNNKLFNSLSVENVVENVTIANNMGEVFSIQLGSINADKTLTLTENTSTSTNNRFDLSTNGTNFQFSQGTIIYNSDGALSGIDVVGGDLFLNHSATIGALNDGSIQLLSNKSISLNLNTIGANGSYGDYDSIKNIALGGELIAGYKKVYFNGLENINGGVLFGDYREGGNGGSDTITFTNMTNGAIFGDNQYNITDYSSSRDDITVTNMSGGLIVGDSALKEDTSGTGTAKDIIVIENLSGDAHVTLDVVDLHSTSTAGDNLWITDVMSGGTIYGDAVTFDSTLTHSFGNDTIYINKITDGTVYGDAANYINGTTQDDSGEDQIIFGHMSGGSIYGGQGNDEISLGTLLYSGNNAVNTYEKIMTGGSIYGGEGDDDISISNMTGGTIDAGEGRDTVYITLDSQSTDLDSMPTLVLGADGELDIVRFEIDERTDPTAIYTVKVVDFEAGTDQLSAYDSEKWGSLKIKQGDGTFVAGSDDDIVAGDVARFEFENYGHVIEIYFT